MRDRVLRDAAVVVEPVLLDVQLLDPLGLGINLDLMELDLSGTGVGAEVRGSMRETEACEGGGEGLRRGCVPVSS